LLIVLVAVIVGVVLGVFLSGGDDEEEAAVRTAAVESESAPAAKSESTEAGGDQSASAPAEEAAPETTASRQAASEDPAQETAAAAPEAPTAEPEPEATASAPPPTFDVVRVSPSGRAVIAGRAEPGSQVTVLEDGMPLGTVEADRRGEWVLVPDSNLESGDRQLSLVQDMPDGSRVASEQVVVLSVPKPQKKPVVAHADSAGDTAPASDGEPAAEADSAAAVASGADSAPAQGDAEEGVIAVLVERKGDGPSKILQSPEVGGEGIGDEAEVTIRSVDYDAEGDVTLAGRTEPEAVVNVYVDEEYVGSARASEEGDWELSPEQEVSPGQHRVRVDKVDDTGIVLARIETPISRARPEELLLGDALVVVQPGNSLWRIARRAYGGGIYYSEIYGANRAQILDPNMIFPGQILTLPVLN